MEFNQPLENWNVSNVTRMVGMFQDAESFNQSLTEWKLHPDVSTEGMFDGATNFDEDKNGVKFFNSFSVICV